MSTETDILESEGEIAKDTDVLGILQRAETDVQIATAKQYPRSLKMFRNEAAEMVTLDEEIAGECMYALKRSGKTIEGPSARFAEIIASAWGNCRAGARVIGHDERFVTAQGVFADLQRNVVITYEVQRRITYSNGQTYSDDMIGVTSNAACSIALRNAVLKGIPKAFWKDAYRSARETFVGNAETLTDRRAKMLDHFQKMGVDEATILEFLEVPGVADISLDHLALLRGTATRIKDGEVTPDNAFAKDQPTGGKKRMSTSPLSASSNEEQETPAEQSQLDPEILRAELAKCESIGDVKACCDVFCEQYPGAADFIEHYSDDRLKEIRDTSSSNLDPDLVRSELKKCATIADAYACRNVLYDRFPNNAKDFISHCCDQRIEEIRDTRGERSNSKDSD